MKKLFFPCLFTMIFCGMCNFAIAQDTSAPLRRATVTYPDNPTVKPVVQQQQPVTTNDQNQDSVIKNKLVELAMSNPEISIADANIKIAEYGLNTAKYSWLSTLSVSSNINEFVISGTKIDSVPVASYYPKYNIGLTVPFDIFSKTKGAKKVATENIASAKAMKQEKLMIIKQEVLTRYENYKEKKELVRLQKISTEGDNDAYLAAQKSYTDGTIQLQEMNKSYQLYIISQSRLVTCERDFNVATIELEEMIGVPVGEVIPNDTSNAKP